ncbi:MAG: hypothetical protein HC836_39445 [Richelia sp. RM2_1_2]|nr:hypothetical protein [Richelia sp. RM2_1_2]
MNWYQIFYLFSVVNNLGTFFGWMTAIFTIITIIAWIVFIIYKMAVNGAFIDGNRDENDDDRRNLAVQRKWVWYSSIFFVFFWLAYIATPTKRDMLLIIAGGTVGEFISNDANAKQIPTDIARFLRAEILKATSEVGEKDKMPEEVKKIKDLSKEQLEELLIDQLGKSPAIDSAINKLK